MDQESHEAVFKYADEFITLANKLFQADKSVKVGMAMRYAATRFCAFEASVRSNDFAEDMEKNIEMFANEFAHYLRVNFEDYKNNMQKPSSFDY